MSGELKPCPFCRKPLFIRESVNAYGRCDTPGCWMHERKMTVPLGDRDQVAAWNTRAELSSLRGEGGWCPRIGEEVRVSESYLELYGEWRDLPLWVTGVQSERHGVGINVTVTEQWPLESRTYGDTDGFYIGRDHSPDQLAPVHRPAARPDSDVIGRLVGAINGVMDTSGARGTYHALKYTDAVEALETLLASLPNTVLPRPRRNASPSEVKTGRQGIGEV